MKIDKTELARLAHLARLHIAPEHQTELLNNLNQIVEWMGKLQEVDTQGIEPLVMMTQETDILREDDVQPSLTQAEALKNATHKNESFFIVPKVVNR